jgi:hypothetical protein
MFSRLLMVANTVGQLGFFKQSAEPKQRRCVGGLLNIQINTNKISDNDAVVNGVLNAIVRQTKALPGASVQVHDASVLSLFASDNEARYQLLSLPTE